MKRVMTGTIVALMALAIFQFVRIARMPSIEDDLRNEVSTLSIQNEDLLRSLKATGLRTTRQTSHHPSVIRAKEATQHTLEYADSMNTWFDQAIMGNNPELLSHRLMTTNLIVTAYLEPEEDISFKPLAEQVQQSLRITDLTLRTLALENDRYSALGLLSYYLDWLSAQAESATLKFDRSFPQRPDTWKKGLITFTTPDKMELNEKYRVVVKISKELKSDLLEQLTPGEKAMVDSLLVGDIMVVRLQGDEFDIKAYDEEEQGVLDDGYTLWEFDVIPTRTGKHQLFVKAGIVYYVKDLGPTRKFFPVYEKEIEIEVSLGRWIASFVTERWEFLLSTIVIPVLTVGYTRWRRRKTQPGSNE
jgi:hypothetical protein